MTKSNHSERMKEITDKLEAGVKEVFSGGRYAAYLQTMSKFPRYSFRNTMLIYLQNPGATRVAGFQTWKSLGRSVNKGETGLQILAPSPYKKTIEVTHDEDGNQLPQPQQKQITIPAFKPVAVFDISQTSGKELPHLTQKLTGDIQEYEALLQCLRELSPYPIVFEEMSGSTNGYCSHEKQVIAIRTGLSQQQTIKTGIHELAHALLGHHIGEIARDTAEVQAESVAFITCEHFGIDSSQYSFGYVAAWSAGKETAELQKSLTVIQEKSTEIISLMEDRLEGIREKRVVLETEKAAASKAVTAQALSHSSEEVQESPFTEALLDWSEKPLFSDKKPLSGSIAAKTAEQAVIQRFEYELTFSARIQLHGKSELCPVEIEDSRFYLKTNLVPGGKLELTPQQTELFKAWRWNLLTKQAQIFQTPGLSISDKVKAAQAVCSTRNSVPSGKCPHDKSR